MRNAPTRIPRLAYFGRGIMTFPVNVLRDPQFSKRDVERGRINYCKCEKKALRFTKGAIHLQETDRFRETRRTIHRLREITRHN